jgi:4-amino-4-deoxy-L-arabinose transferase-like glycosyltransferase
LALLSVTLLSLVLHVWGLAETGYGNTYYAAATRSMTESWHNFFFASFDPGGFISVDKPPVFLWIDALSARVFGYSSLALLLPSAVAGAAAVALLWMIVRRNFGVTAATVAALVLALTPISVAVNRLNLPEPFLVLALIGAAGCVLQSLRSKRWLWWTVAAGLLVGVAFNVKMLVGWIPGPALGLALVAGARGAWWLAWREWMPRVLIYGAVALAASLSWTLVVDAWPASDRPYVGGSKDNTVTDLILGYNGIGRVEGETGAGAGGGRGGAAPTRPGFNNGFPSPRGDGGNGGGAPGAAANVNGPGGIIAGAPDTLRMFDAANGGQIAWFLPFAAIGGVLSLWRWRNDGLPRASVVLWLGWVALFAGVFSYTQGIYHSYYTAALAPGIAALVGISCADLADLVKRNRGWLAVGVMLIAVTLYVQLVVAGRFEGFFAWVTPFAVVAALVGAGLMLASLWDRRVPAFAGLAVAVAGLLFIPAAWSAYEAAHASSNTTLPQAGPRGAGAASRSFGSQPFDDGVAQLATWLEAHDDPVTDWDLVVSSAQTGSRLIAEHDLSVMALGGFSGADPTLNASEFGEYVAAGDVRYVLVTNTGPGGGGPTRALGGPRFGPSPQTFGGSFATAGAGTVLAAVQSACEPVADRGLPPQYRGSLYDCAGQAERLGAAAR